MIIRIKLQNVTQTQTSSLTDNFNDENEIYGNIMQFDYPKLSLQSPLKDLNLQTEKMSRILDFNIR